MTRNRAINYIVTARRRLKTASGAVAATRIYIVVYLVPTVASESAKKKKGVET